MKIQFLLYLNRKPAYAAVIDIRRQSERFVALAPRHFVGLARDVSRILGANLDLLGNRENGRAMAGRATERVRKEFSLENVVACQAALYRDLIDRSGGSRFKDDRNMREQRGHTCGAL